MKVGDLVRWHDESALARPALGLVVSRANRQYSKTGWIPCLKIYWSDDDVSQIPCWYPEYKFKKAWS